MTYPLYDFSDLISLLSAAVVTFVLCLLLYPPYIKWLKHKQIEQFIREDGPQSHAAKAKTPTMGGLCFIFATLLSSSGMLLTSEQVNRQSLYVPMLVISVAALCGLIGFADDYGKVTSRSNKGISGKIRLLIEFLLGFVLGLGLYFLGSPIHRLVLGAGTNIQLDNGLAVFFALFMSSFLVAATSNALNLHDGMDGLAAGTSIQIFATLSLMLLAIQEPGLACIAACVSGALAAFLAFNRYPAKVFMGDTGSLFLGALLACLVCASGLTLWLIPLGLIYIVETLSVMLQVVYFKLTKPYTPEKPMSFFSLIFTKLTKRLPGEGKRIFRMAPIHHHFEVVFAEKGVAEWQVVIWFWICQLVICLLTYGLFCRAGQG